MKSFLVWEYINKETDKKDLNRTLGSCCKYLIKDEISQDWKIGIIVATESSKYEISKRIKNDKRVQVQNVCKLANDVREYDIIIIACAENKDVIFFSALNRINRAFTRAKTAVYIVGPSNLFNSEVNTQVINFVISLTVKIIHRYLIAVSGIAWLNTQRTTIVSKR